MNWVWRKTWDTEKDIEYLQTRIKEFNLLEQELMAQEEDPLIEEE